MKRNKSHTFQFLGYLISFKVADTIWVENMNQGKLGAREDFFINMSRTYVRDMKSYMYNIILWKLHLSWAKI